MIVIANKKKYNSIVKKISKTVTSFFKLPKNSYIELNFVSKAEIKAVNKAERGINKITDVLSFPNLNDIFGKKIKIKDYPLDINPETNMLFLGTILVCNEKIKLQAKEYKTGRKREFSYLLTHGILHILGYDHEKAKDKKVMREMEEKILEFCNV